MTYAIYKKLYSLEKDYLNLKTLHCPTGRIYTRIFTRKSIKDLRFNPSIKMSEDTLFMIDYMYNKPRIGIIDRVWYNYYINDYSVSNSKDKKELVNKIKEFISEIELRKETEQNALLKTAYSKRIKKSLAYITEIQNN